MLNYSPCIIFLVLGKISFLTVVLSKFIPIVRIKNVIIIIVIIIIIISSLQYTFT